MQITPLIPQTIPRGILRIAPGIYSVGLLYFVDPRPVDYNRRLCWGPQSVIPTGAGSGGRCDPAQDMLRETYELISKPKANLGQT